MIKSLTSLLLLFAALFSSCSKEPNTCFTPPASIHMQLIDKDGNDLLNPSNPNGYKSTDISIYHMDNGKKTFSKISLDSLTDTKSYFLSTEISWNADKGRDFFLQLSPIVTDSIYLRYDKMSKDQCAFFKFMEFRYNNTIQRLEVTNGNFQSFNIVK
jgi:hypothetical protein